MERGRDSPRNDRVPCRPPVAGRGSVAGLRMAGLRMDGLRVDGLRMDGLRVDGLRVDGLRVAGRGLRRHRRLRCRGRRAVEAVQVVEAVFYTHLTLPTIYSV